MQPSATRPAPSPERPQALSVLAVLAAIGGIGAILGVLAGAFLIHGLPSLDGRDALIVTPALALAALYLAFAYGAWTVKPWAWTVGVVAGAGTVAYVIVILATQWGELMRDAPPLAWMSILVAVIAAAGVVVLFRADVKGAFGRT